MITVNSIVQLSMLQSKIDNVVKTINNDGLENTLENRLHKMKSDRYQNLKDRELQGVEAAQRRYSEFETVFGAMEETLSRFKELLIERNSETTSSSDRININHELDNLKNNFKNLLNTKSHTGDLMFDHQTMLMVGDNISVPRTFSDNYVKLNGESIDNLLQQHIDSETANLDEFDSIMNLIISRKTEIGARNKGLDSMKNFYENQKLTDAEFMDKRYQLEEAIIQFNDLTLNKEALNKVIGRLSMISLVNYI